mmetsp:Transcript_20455/g.49749  ORF Transcript_20455/g.49749 Transcript_20455/m.49749 type:complete len:142 (-) Transcript_20455:908-1333(-)
MCAVGSSSIGLSLPFRVRRTDRQTDRQTPTQNTARGLTTYGIHGRRYTWEKQETDSEGWQAAGDDPLPRPCALLADRCASRKRSRLGRDARMDGARRVHVCVQGVHPKSMTVSWRTRRTLSHMPASHVWESARARPAWPEK